MLLCYLLIIKMLLFKIMFDFFVYMIYFSSITVLHNCCLAKTHDTVMAGSVTVVTIHCKKIFS